LATDPSIRWCTPAAPKDSHALDRWRSAVGPPLVRPALHDWTSPVDELTIVTWNTALGAGDVTRFAAGLPRGRPMVLLLQEVYRSGPDVPGLLPPGAAFARQLGGAAPGMRDAQIEPIAAALGLSLFYVPSMRNGSPAVSSEDRGNAILSSLPLADLAAVELPFERQRRVALAATIAGVTSTGTPWRLRVVNAHLDNTFNPLRLSLASEYGRTRQARGLLSTLDDQEPLVLGGDFNTWSGFSDQAYRTLARSFPATNVVDRRPTFRGWLRLDHLFFRPRPGWTFSFRRADERFGSDHFPLVGSLRVH
jgi:endonuclease/exonuclease/phosphatase family metal-dependent hydrolase